MLFSKNRNTQTGIISFFSFGRKNKNTKKKKKIQHACITYSKFNLHKNTVSGIKCLENSSTVRPKLCRTSPHAREKQFYYMVSKYFHACIAISMLFFHQTTCYSARIETHTNWKFFQFFFFFEARITTQKIQHACITYSKFNMHKNTVSGIKCPKNQSTVCPKLCRTSPQVGVKLHGH